MVASISLKNRMARSANAVASFVPVSLMISGLALVIILTIHFAEEPAIGAANGAVPEFKAQAASPASAMDTVPPADSVPETLTPRMHAALAYVSRRYRVSATALEPIFGAAQLTGRELRLDPLLIIAVIGIESRFNPFSESTKGAQGLMQVMPRFHQDKLPEGSGKSSFFDPVVNVRVGAQVLEESIRRNGGLVAGLQQFAGASDDDEQTYATKVIAEKQRLEQAARLRAIDDAQAG
jgi:hypothetical protein